MRKINTEKEQLSERLKTNNFFLVNLRKTNTEKEQLSERLKTNKKINFNISQIRYKCSL